MKYRVVIFSHSDQTHPSRDVSLPRTYIIPHSSYTETTRKFLDSNLKKNIHPILALSLSLITWHLSPPSIPNIRWWYSLPGPEAKATLGAVPPSLCVQMLIWTIMFPTPSHSTLPPTLFFRLKLCPLLHKESTTIPHRI